MDKEEIDDKEKVEAPEEAEAAEEAESTEETESAEAAKDKKDLDLPQQGDPDASAESSLFEEDNTSAKDKEQNLQVLYEVPVQVSAVLGQTTMQVNQLLKLGRGAVVELDRRVGDAIDIYVNDRLVARGEVIVVEDHLGVTLTEIIKPEQAA